MPTAMLIYIDLEHPSIRSDPAWGQKRLQQKLRFEALSGCPCLLLRYELALAGWVERLQPAAVLLSGMMTEWESYESGWLDGILGLIRRWEGPMIGFCGGHQLIARAYGAEVGPMRALAGEETEARPDFGAGLFKEDGFLPVRVVAEDALFAGLPDEIIVREEHYWEVKELPPGFVQLAQSVSCRIQAMRHEHRPIYGAQFHPERYDDAHPHGRQVLVNFLRLVAG
jgi:GMP synthase (glutamine-hydrolysing)